MLLFEQSLRKIDYVFRLTGMHLRSRENYNEKKARTIYIINSVLLNLDIIAAISYFIKGVRMGDSLTSLTYASPCITLAILSNFKSLPSVIYHKYLDELVLMLRDFEVKSNLKDYDYEDIHKDIKFLHLVLKVQNYSNWILIFTFPLMPVTLSAVKYFALNEIDLLLPLYAVYPFDATDIKYWPFVIIRQFWSILVGVLYVFGIDALYYICCTYIQVQFKLLQQEVKSIIPRPLSSDGRENLQRDVDEELGLKVTEVVRWHQDIIAAVCLMETIYSKTTLVNFVSSSFLICLTGFNVTTIGDVVFIISFMSFLVICFFQIYFLCLFGDMIMQSSTEVSNAVYNSRWYLSRTRHAKELNIILMRAQRPCKLTAYGFADVNLTAFAKIINTAWSYFAVLKTVDSI